MRRQAVTQREIDYLCKSMRATLKKPGFEGNISYRYALAIISYLKRQIKLSEGQS